MNPGSKNLLLLPLAMLLTFGVAACDSGNRPPPPPPVYQPPVPQQPVVPQYSGPVLNQDGTCTGTPAAPTPAVAPAAPPAMSTTAPAAAAPANPVALGIGECDLVRLKGRTPTDILIGDTGRGGRQTQVLYAEPTGRELYFFTNNKLDRIRTPDRNEGGM